MDLATGTTPQASRSATETPELATANSLDLVLESEVGELERCRYRPKRVLPDRLGLQLPTLFPWWRQKEKSTPFTFGSPADAPHALSAAQSLLPTLSSNMLPRGQRIEVTRSSVVGFSANACS